MAIKSKIEFIPFRDGRVLIKNKFYNYTEKAVGYKRHYAAKSAGVEVDRVIQIPYTTEIEAEEKAYIGTDIYIIELVQPTKATKPHSTALSLRKYSVNRNEY